MVDLIVELLKPEYDKTNISKQAVMDTVKQNKIHYFLYHDREKMIKTIINRFR